MRLFAAAFVLASTLPAAAATPSPTKWVVVMAGRVAGAQTLTVAADGTRDYVYEYNDRGRGPKVHTRIRLAPDGTIASLDSSGNDYLKSAFTESFSTAAGRVRWRNPVEHGEAAAGGFYSSYYGVPDEAALLAAALVRAPGHTLPVYPTGKAHLDEVARKELHVGANKRTVVEYAISGLDLAPWTVWLDTDGSYFGGGSSWMMTIREGWESTAQTLIDADTAYARAHLADIARRVQRRPAHGVAFVHAAVADVDHGTLLSDQTVVIDGKRIVAVGDAAKVTVPAGAEVVDATGRTLVPGLWDMHAHMDDLGGLLDLANGVTSARDLGNDVDESLARRKSYDDGALVGPRLTLAGLVDGRGPYAGPTKLLVDDEAEGKAVIDKIASLGYAQLKIYSSVKPSLVPALVRLAHARGLRVSGHVPAGMTAADAVKAGFDELQHVNFLVLNFLAAEVKDTRTPERFTAVADKAATLDLDGPKMRAFIKLLVDHKTVLDPTVNAFEDMFEARRGVLAPGSVAVADRLPASLRRGLYGGGLPVPEGKDARYRQSFRALLRIVRVMHDAGVQLVPGTDSMAGFGLLRELELWQEAGLPPADIVRAATIGSARLLKRDGELGSVAAGKLADVVLVDGDPLADVNVLRRAVVVVKDGVVVDRGAIFDALGIAR